MNAKKCETCKFFKPETAAIFVRGGGWEQPDAAECTKGCDMDTSGDVRSDFPFKNGCGCWEPGEEPTVQESTEECDLCGCADVNLCGCRELDKA